MPCRTMRTPFRATKRIPECIVTLMPTINCQGRSSYGLLVLTCALKNKQTYRQAFAHKTYRYHVSSHAHHLLKVVFCEYSYMRIRAVVLLGRAQLRHQQIPCGIGAAVLIIARLGSWKSATISRSPGSLE